jgi:outer membrane protein assembly factor BamA
MKRKFTLLLIALILLSAALPTAAQKKSTSKKTASPSAQAAFTPKSIQFKGAPGYTDQELLDAMGLKLGTPIVYSTVKAHSQKLLDTGLFSSAGFTYSGAALVFNLVPSTALYPLRLENLPLVPGKELDAALQARFPLYHGKVPFDGGLTEDVRKALVEMLAAKGIQATVAASPYTDQKLFQVTAMSYAITAPRVLLGEIRLEVTPVPSDPKTVPSLASLTGSAYSVEGSPRQIESILGDYYRDNGNLEAEVHVTAQDDPIVAQGAILVPFQVKATPGMRYKLVGIRLAPGLLLSQAEFDKQARIPSGAYAVSAYVRDNWSYIESQYHNKGYMEAVVYPTPSFDRDKGTVFHAPLADLRPHVSVAASDRGEAAAPGDRLPGAGAAAAPLRQAGAGAAQPLRPGGSALALKHRAERHHRRRQLGDRRRDWRVQPAGHQLAGGARAVPLAAADARAGGPRRPCWCAMARSTKRRWRASRSPARSCWR